jgi:tetratricopeptide (TPR) repeat protein
MINDVNDSWSLEKTWGLLLDADMILRVEDLPASKEILQNAEKVNTSISCFQLLQKNGNLVYWNTRLIRMSHNWVCRGVTHEYWESVNGGQTANVMGHVAKVMDDILWIDDVNDGGAKMDKYERDARLLEEGIADPATPEQLKVRYYFYLAQTYLVMRNIPRAVEYYNKRIEAGGWMEEVWYSHYQKFQITQSREDLWRGIECMPQRLENVHAHFKNKRERGIRYTQEDFAIGAVGYSYVKKWNPRDTYLFMEEDIYTWRFMDEYSLVCFFIHYYKVQRYEYKSYV